MLSLDVVQSGGLEFDTSLASGPVMKVSHVTADAPDDPNSRSDGSDIGVSTCEYPGVQDELLDLTIYQAPFDAPRGRDQAERSLRQEGGRDGQVAGFRTLSTTDTNLHTWTTAIFADTFYAVVHLMAPRNHDPEDPRMTAVVGQVAERLQRPPSAPAGYAYDGEFAHVLPPCEAFTSDDFQQAVGFATDGRPREEYDLAKRHTVPDATSGTIGQDEHFFVSTACTQENQAAANAGVGTTPAQGVTVKIENYPTAEMATQANDYDCAQGKGYRHPGGDPKPVPFSVGDGLSCLVSVGGGLQSPLAFKAGRSTVEISVFSVKNLKDNDTAIRLYTTVANAVAARLTQR
ncbi:hypothetical protein H4696_009741 [Amycolatopsis lexingtonensis]|uniref:DUF3558 domain-containing protein n=1 Tax=Amycolatopsis lexingtonensis TaxID=218822 RepID=A0ABR9IHH0_9PSEU|nr:hypothetical protein [Amycolatopsis lexingtonensis]MBE1502641.1 hypothetical protein [Amycolatopsis lexingtonensis]